MKILLCITLFAVSAIAQNICRTPPPSLRGISVGMTAAQVRTAYPKAEKLDNYMGLGTFMVIRPETSPVKWKSNLREFVITFDIQDKVESLRIAYTPEIKWLSAREFVDVVSPSLKISKTTWNCSSDAICNVILAVESSPECPVYEMSALVLSSGASLSLQRPKEIPSFLDPKKRAFKP